MTRILVAKHLHNALGLFVQGLHRTQHGSLFVECFAGPGDEGRWNAERRTVGILQDVSRTHRVPSGVATGFESRTNTAGRKTRSVRFTLDQFLAREFADRGAIPGG